MQCFIHDLISKLVEVNSLNDQKAIESPNCCCFQCEIIYLYFTGHMLFRQAAVIEVGQAGYIAINSLAPRILMVFKKLQSSILLYWLVYSILFYDNVLRWMPKDLTNEKSTLVQLMGWCCQATSHYLNQCWPRSPTPYSVTRPQWVN